MPTGAKLGMGSSRWHSMTTFTTEVGTINPAWSLYFPTSALGAEKLRDVFDNLADRCERQPRAQLCVAAGALVVERSEAEVDGVHIGSPGGSAAPTWRSVEMLEWAQRLGLRLMGGRRRVAHTLRPRNQEARDALRRGVSRALQRGGAVCRGVTAGGGTLAEVLCRACREAPRCGHRVQKYPGWSAVKSKVDRRNAEPGPDVRRSLSRAIANERRAFRRREANRQLHSDARPWRPYRKLLGLQQADG